MVKPLVNDAVDENVATPLKLDVPSTVKYPSNTKLLKVKLVAFKVSTVNSPRTLTSELKVAIPPKVDVVPTVK